MDCNKSYNHTGLQSSGRRQPASYQMEIEAGTVARKLESSLMDVGAVICDNTTKTDGDFCESATNLCATARPEMFEDIVVALYIAVGTTADIVTFCSLSASTVIPKMGTHVTANDPVAIDDNNAAHFLESPCPRLFQPTPVGLRHTAVFTLFQSNNHRPFKPNMRFEDCAANSDIEASLAMVAKI